MGLKLLGHFHILFIFFAYPRKVPFWVNNMSIFNFAFKNINHTHIQRTTYIHLTVCNELFPFLSYVADKSLKSKDRMHGCCSLCLCNVAKVEMKSYKLAPLLCSIHFFSSSFPFSIAMLFLTCQLSHIPFQNGFQFSILLLCLFVCLFFSSFSF